jgi:hypothetical protein
MQVILYPNEETGGVCVMMPILSSGLSIHQIGKKDVPVGLPYIIVDSSEIPDAPQEALEVDFSEPHGHGGIGAVPVVEEILPEDEIPAEGGELPPEEGGEEPPAEEPLP